MWDTMDDAESRIIWSLVRQVDITEVYSPQRVTQVCSKFGLTPGMAVDLTTGWNLADRKQQDILLDKIKTQ